jgi:F-type H+-transporting ATPase subunit epsilon
MKLRILVPEEVAVDRPVVKVVAEAENGVFCLRPRHIDFVAALVPGLLSYEDQEGNEEFLALDQGLLVKCGEEVLVSTARVIRDRPLGELQRALVRELESLDEHQRRARAALGRIEADFVRQLVELERHVHG